MATSDAGRIYTPLTDVIGSGRSNLSNITR
jgi:hypothetical protein